MYELEELLVSVKAVSQDAVYIRGIGEYLSGIHNEEEGKYQSRKELRDTAMRFEDEFKKEEG